MASKTLTRTCAAAGAALLTAGLLGAPAFARERAGSGGAASAAAVSKITHADATGRFRAAGIAWTSSGGCSDRNNAGCTSFDQLNLATAQGAVTLKGATGCALTITGGTETGHASGTYSHWNGYKLDFSPTTCVTNYITGTFTRIADRGDGARQYKSASGNIYARESNHWDVTYYNCGGC
ncbi:hypothetical protein ABT160_09430 [Streptomyces sp. NPDC001941]|uniref:hypothetical protein n=1 Tax=Streptomyces sp. NPDC001941 TaxID=3154659 RepID=UPI0033303F78